MNKMRHSSFNLGMKDMFLNYGYKISKARYHTEFRCQHKPASFSLAFKLSDTACCVGGGDRGLEVGSWGLGVGDWGLGVGSWGWGVGGWGLGVGGWG